MTVGLVIVAEKVLHLENVVAVCTCESTNSNITLSSKQDKSRSSSQWSSVNWCRVRGASMWYSKLHGSPVWVTSSIDNSKCMRCISFISDTKLGIPSIIVCIYQREKAVWPALPNLPHRIAPTLSRSMTITGEYTWRVSRCVSPITFIATPNLSIILYTTNRPACRHASIPHIVNIGGRDDSSRKDSYILLLVPSHCVNVILSWPILILSIRLAIDSSKSISTVIASIIIHGIGITCSHSVQRIPDIVAELIWGIIISS